MSFLRDCARFFKQLLNFLRIDRKEGGPIRIGLLCRGFFSCRDTVYPFDKYDRKWFLSDWAVETHFWRLNSAFIKSQLTDKLCFHFLLRELGLGDRLAPLIGLLVDGRFQSFSNHASVEAGLAQYERLVVKPVDGHGGRGVFILSRVDELPKHGTFILEAVFKQREYSAAIFPGSINTIRVMTIKPRHEEPFIIGAGHRFGVNHSAPVDNISRGGVCAHVEEETGRLSAARSLPNSFPYSLHTHHPETKAAIEGVVVPCWPEIKSYVLELARAVPGLTLAGWDIVLTPEGPRLIEANGSVPNPELIQYGWPLLLKPATRMFFADQHVISRKLSAQLAHLQTLGSASQKKD